MHEIHYFFCEFEVLTTLYNFGAILKNDEFITNSVPLLKYSVPFVKDSVPFIKDLVPFINNSFCTVHISVSHITRDLYTPSFDSKNSDKLSKVS